MELKTIELPEPMQKRLESELGAVRQQYKLSGDNKLLFDAIDKAIWSHKESEPLASALIGIAGGSDVPAIVIDKLPQDPELSALAQKAFALSINSGHYRHRDELGNSMVNEADRDKRATEEFHEKHSIENLAKYSQQKLHADNVGDEKTPHLRIIGGQKVGSKPLTTAVASIEDWIDETAHLMDLNRDTSNAITQSMTVDDITGKIKEALKAPVWKSLQLIHEVDGVDSIKTESAIFDNPNNSANAPKYGLLRDPRTSLKLSYTIPQEVLLKSGLSEAFLHELVIYGEESLKTLKNKSAEVLLKPGKMLVFNDHLVLHGAGNFIEAPDLIDGKDRDLLSSYVPVGLAITPEEAQKPGTAPLASRINIGRSDSVHPIR